MSMLAALSGARSDLDPALLAFVKCHVTSTLTWDALRFMADHGGAWVGAEDIARAIHRSRPDVERSMRQLARDGVLDELRSGDPDDTSFRLPSMEPTTVVLQRLIHESMRNRDLRAIIAAHLLRSQKATSAKAA